MKTRKTKPKPVKCGRVTHVSVSRLFNLGNYQNIKYDISAEIAPGESANETLRRMQVILQCLAPFRTPEAVAHLKSIEGKTPEELSEYEKGHLDEWRVSAESYARRKQMVGEALHALDDLGGHSIFKDAKATWQDDDDPMF